MTSRKIVQGLLLAALCVPLVTYAAQRKPLPESREYSDSAVVSRIKSELRQEDAANAANIRVRATKGRVLLTGIVPTEEDAARAEGIAKASKGVVTVQNNIQVGGTIYNNVGATR